MAFIKYNNNPDQLLTDDCTVRAISTIMNQSWETTYVGLAVQGFIMHAMPVTNFVWGAYLEKYGWKRSALPDTCPNCYTVKDFCYDNPIGIYLLATGSHVLAVVDGNYYDTSDSGMEVPIYAYRRIIRDG